MVRTIPLPLETQPWDILTPGIVSQNFLFDIDNVTRCKPILACLRTCYSNISRRR